MMPNLFNFLKDWLTNLIFIALSIFLLIQSSGYPKTARAFPRLLLIFMLLLAVLDIIYNLLNAGKNNIDEKNLSTENTTNNIYKEKTKTFTNFFPTHYVNALAVIVLMFIFLIFIHVVGFITGTFIFTIFAPWLLGYKNLKNLFFSSIGITCFMYLIFIVIMKSLLPQGLIIQYFLG